MIKLKKINIQKDSKHEMVNERIGIKIKTIFFYWRWNWKEKKINKGPKKIKITKRMRIKIKIKMKFFFIKWLNWKKNQFTEMNQKNKNQIEKNHISQLKDKIENK
jgi:hypothetical protein